MDFYFGLRLTNPMPGAISGANFTESDEANNYGLLTDANIDVSSQVPYFKLGDPATNSAVRFTIDGQQADHFSDRADDFSDPTETFSEILEATGVGKANAVIFYRTVKSPPSFFNISSSNVAATGYSSVLATTEVTTEETEWLIYDLTTSIKSYFVFNVTNFSKLEISELMIGQGITGFPQYDIGIKDSAKPHVTQDESYGGIEATNKQFQTSFILEFTWNGLSEINKNKIVELRDAIYNRGRGFLMIDGDGTKTFVRLLEDIIVTEIAYKLYNVKIKLDPVRPVDHTDYNTFGMWPGTFGGSLETFGDEQRGFNVFGFTDEDFGLKTETFGEA